MVYQMNNISQKQSQSQRSKVIVFLTKFLPTNPFWYDMKLGVLSHPALICEYQKFETKQMEKVKKKIMNIFFFSPKVVFANLIAKLHC